jgi:translation initiation factor IF-1
LIAYLTYILFGTFDVEYEYSVTHDYIEVSKIMSKRRRKTMVRINMSDIAIVAPVTYKEHATIDKRSMGKVVQATEYKNDEDNYYIIGRTAQVERIKAKGNYANERGLQGGKMCLLYITPDDNILEALNTYVKSKVIKL